MSTTDGTKNRANGWKVVSFLLTMFVAQLSLKGIYHLTGRPVPVGLEFPFGTVSKLFRSSPGVDKAPAQHLTASYPAEFEKYWGGADSDASLIRLLEGKFIVEFGVMPNQKQKQFIADKFAPAYKEFCCQAFLKNGSVGKNPDAVGREFMQNWGGMYFGELLSLSDKDQLKEIKQSAGEQPK